MKNIFTLFLFVLLGLASCQQKEESPVTDNQTTERSDPYCCDSTEITNVTWACADGINLLGYSYELPVENLFCCDNNSCQPQCTYSSNISGYTNFGALNKCLNKSINSCEEKTVFNISPSTNNWVCLGLLGNCLPTYNSCWANNGGFYQPIGGSTLSEAAANLCILKNQLKESANLKSQELNLACEEKNVIIEYSCFYRVNQCISNPFFAPELCPEIWVRFYCCD
jgi:hypothetical protein